MHYIRYSILLTLSVWSSVQADCNDIKSCGKCADSSSWLGSCRWCSLDNQCHAYGSKVNKCGYYENIKKGAGSCESDCPVPDPGVNSSACSWYTDTTDSSDPMEWKGGDFLPDNYKAAASCACSGCSAPPFSDCDQYWALNPPIEKCVRQQILTGHQEMTADVRTAFKECVWPCYEFSELVYAIHKNAYSSCYCTGAVAPLEAWEAIFFAGELVPCNSPKQMTATPPLTILDSILAFGRCGCGW